MGPSLLTLVDYNEKSWGQVLLDHYREQLATIASWGSFSLSGRGGLGPDSFQSPIPL